MSFPPDAPTVAPTRPPLRMRMTKGTSCLRLGVVGSLSTTSSHTARTVKTRTVILYSIRAMRRLFDVEQAQASGPADDGGGQHGAKPCNEADQESAEKKHSILLNCQRLPCGDFVSLATGSYRSGQRAPSNKDEHKTWPGSRAPGQPGRRGRFRNARRADELCRKASWAWRRASALPIAGSLTQRA